MSGLQVGCFLEAVAAIAGEERNVRPLGYSVKTMPTAIWSFSGPGSSRTT